MNRHDVLPLLSTLERACRFGSPEDKRRAEAYERIREQIRFMDEVELFYGLYFLAVQDEFQTPAGFAASLLRELKPVCPLSCKDALEVLVSGAWNVSTKALPFYLVEQFGKELIKDAIKQKRVGPLTKIEQAYLETVDYWVNLANDSVSVGVSVKAMDA